MTNLYEEAYAKSMKDPDAFWAEAAEDCHWYKKWDKVLDDSNKPFYRWFTGGICNTCYNALDFHVENGRGDQDALIYDSPVTDTIKKYTYRELRDEVATFAGVLANQGVTKGDRVIIYMPMIRRRPWPCWPAPASARSTRWSSAGFAAKELATRIEDAKPKVIVSASCGIEVKKVIAYKPLLDEAIDISSAKPEKCVILQRPHGERPA
jgi:propionyl-CoA synthetase